MWGDSLMRQFTQAFACRLRHYVHEDDFELIVPAVERRQWAGTCPIITREQQKVQWLSDAQALLGPKARKTSASRHCRMEGGCVSFGLDNHGRSAMASTRACFSQPTSPLSLAARMRYGHSSNMNNLTCEFSSW